MQEYLQEGEEGFIAGENFENPEYIDSLRQRRKLRYECMVKLQALLPIHEAEERIAELEQKIIHLMGLIEERAPFLLPGYDGGRQH